MIPAKKRFLGIAGEGMAFTVVPAALSLVLLTAGRVTWAAPVGLLALCIALFFRDPERGVRAQMGRVLSPADGTVVSVDVRPEERYLGQDALRICIFMSVFNVHINRIPADGRVLEVKHHKGGFRMAHLEAASLENERTEILMTDDCDRRSLMVQIAGLVARRIVCRLEPGDVVKSGQRFGLIRFGSRVDLHLPAEAKPLVAVGDKVRGGLTALAELE